MNEVIRNALVVFGYAFFASLVSSTLMSGLMAFDIPTQVIVVASFATAAIMAGFKAFAFLVNEFNIQVPDDPT